MTTKNEDIDCLGCRLGLPTEKSSWDLRVTVHRDGREAIQCTSRGQTRFLQVLREVGSINKACTQVGVSRRTALRWRQKDEKFDAEVREVVKAHAAKWGKKGKVAT